LRGGEGECAGDWVANLSGNGGDDVTQGEDGVID
jgi:hypothetical protein